MAEYAPDYLLFTDADILFRADTVRRAVAYAEASRADHFVLLPTTLAKTWGEAMMLSGASSVHWPKSVPKGVGDSIWVSSARRIGPGICVPDFFTMVVPELCLKPFCGMTAKL